jgi:type IV pilus assembly protein PilB
VAGSKRPKLGQLLLEAGLISEAQLQEVLAEQQKSRKRIGKILLKRGLITEARLLSLIEEQLHIPQINLYSAQIDAAAVAAVPRHMAQRYLVFPVEIKDNHLRLAMADPFNLTALDELAMYAGLEVEPVLASESAINYMINQYYGVEDMPPERAAENDGGAAADDLTALRSMVEEAPIVKIVDALIRRAVDEGASDIHLEPAAAGLRVRMRIDGVLHDLMPYPQGTQALIVSRVKVMANLDIAERRLPQDGNLVYQAGGKEINLRISTMPTIHGEKVVLRLLEKERVIMPLEKLGFTPENYRAFHGLLLNPYGMILVTGPTGCGKTTTLYSALHYLNRPADNIITVEDPVEYRLEGINQIQVNPRIDLTFAVALRFILRQDPDIIMVGEIRDPETARIAVQAALTGHLVLSTLHTNNAAGAITRLIDMGVENYLITACLAGVVAQRLVRMICPRCAEPYRLPAEERQLFRRLFGKEAPAELTRGKGCKYCNRTGYRGRTSIQELLLLNRELRQLIMAGAPAHQLHEKAVAQGMVPLLQIGLRCIENGVTTLPEVARTVFSSVIDTEDESYAEIVHYLRR